ncbi:Protein-tyrosine phosphatase [Trichostrongylus colubriformis]|uniref:Protein-tyrosine phosphatase n=1 Tax=Trichostrongylus colubriformis TaxID=6319 RepID=A0AAN8F2Z5_TRICO
MLHCATFGFAPRGVSRDSYEVHHLSYSEWPDHTAPLDPTPTVALIKLARSLCNNNPIVVHCSGGIGRAVCFIGIDYIAQKVKENSDVKMVDMLKDLRNQRFQGVQGIIQYTFIHICVLELFVQDGILPREGKYTRFLNSYVHMLTRYNARMAEMATKEEASKKEEKKTRNKSASSHDKQSV